VKRTLAIAGVVWIEMLRRKDLYVLGVLLAALLGALMSLDVFGLGGAAGYVKDAGLLLIWLFSWILAVTVCARQLPQEEARGTVFFLLSKPLRRGELVAGKWLGGWTVTAIATLVFYLVLAAFVGLRGGEMDGVTTAQAWLLHAGALGLVGALSVALSTRLTFGAAASLAFVLSAASFVLLPAVPHLFLYAGPAARTAFLAVYYGLPHLELFDLRQRVVHDWGPAPWPAVAGSAAYGALWCALWLVLAWLGYGGKRFGRRDA